LHRFWCKIGSRYKKAIHEHSQALKGICVAFDSSDFFSFFGNMSLAKKITAAEFQQKLMPVYVKGFKQ